MASRVQLTKPPYLKALFYGQAGSTKTRTAYTAAWDERTSPALVLEAGGNPLAARDYNPAPDIIHIDALDEFNPLYEWLATGQPVNTPAYAGMVNKYELHPPYKTVVLDGVTEIQRYSFNLVTGNRDKGPGTIPQATQIQHFGQVLGQMTTLARLFFGLPMNVIVTALEREDKDESTGSIMYKPLLLGQSAGEVCGYAYVVARMLHRARLEGKILRAVEDSISEKTVSVALFQPSGKYVAKDQYGVLGPYMVDPSVPKMMNLIYGEKK